MEEPMTYRQAVEQIRDLQIAADGENSWSFWQPYSENRPHEGIRGAAIEERMGHIRERHAIISAIRNGGVG